MSEKPFEDTYFYGWVLRYYNSGGIKPYISAINPNGNIASRFYREDIRTLRGVFNSTIGKHVEISYPHENKTIKFTNGTAGVVVDDSEGFKYVCVLETIELLEKIFASSYDQVSTVPESKSERKRLGLCETCGDKGYSVNLLWLCRNGHGKIF